MSIAAILAVMLLGNTSLQIYSNVLCNVQGAGPTGSGACHTGSGAIGNDLSLTVPLTTPSGTPAPVVVTLGGSGASVGLAGGVGTVDLSGIHASNTTTDVTHSPYTALRIVTTGGNTVGLSGSNPTGQAGINATGPAPSCTAYDTYPRTCIGPVGGYTVTATYDPPSLSLVAQAPLEVVYNPDAWWHFDDAPTVNGTYAVGTLAASGDPLTSIAKDVIGQPALPNGTHPGQYDFTANYADNVRYPFVMTGGSESGLMYPPGGRATGLGTSVAFSSLTSPASAVHGQNSASMTVPTWDTLQGNHARTVSVWFKTSDNSRSFDNIFEIVDPNNPNHFMLVTLNTNFGCFDGGGGEGITVSLGGPWPGWGSGLSYGVWGNNVACMETANLADGHWHFLVVTTSDPSVWTSDPCNTAANQLCVYVDGMRPDGHTEIAGTDSYWVGQPFQMGAINTGASGTLDFGANTVGGSAYMGNLQEALVYPKALTEPMVQIEYNAGRAGPTLQAPTAESLAISALNPVDFWRLGDNGQAAVDSGGYDVNHVFGNNPGLYNTAKSFGGGSNAPYASTMLSPGYSNVSGMGSATATNFDSGNTDSAGSGTLINANGAGVRVNAIPALQNSNTRTVEVWFKTTSDAANQTLVGESNAWPNAHFYVDLLSTAGASGYPGNTAGGILVQYAGAAAAWVPVSAASLSGDGCSANSSSALADGCWHQVVVSTQQIFTTQPNQNGWSLQTQVFVDDQTKHGYFCCPGNGWSALSSGSIIDAGAGNNFDYFDYGTGAGSVTGNVTLGYAVAADAPNYGFGTESNNIWHYFKGQMEDVAIFNTVLSASQISHTWGVAHPGAGCSSLTLSSIAGNAYGGTVPTQLLNSGGTRSKGVDSPVSASASHTCDYGADPYVTFYYGATKHVQAGSPACYQGTATNSQIPWSAADDGSTNNWVYCLPGAPGTANPNANAAKGALVSTATGPVGVTFYQALLGLSGCTDPGGNQDPRYFIVAKDAYGLASSGNTSTSSTPGHAMPSTGIALNTTQDGNLEAETLAYQNGGTPGNFTPPAPPGTLVVPSSPALSQSWGLINGDLNAMAEDSGGATVATHLPGAVCLPTPRPASGNTFTAASSKGGDLSALGGVLGGECITYLSGNTTDGHNSGGCIVGVSNYATWVEQTTPYIFVTPDGVAVSVNQAQVFTTTAYTAGGLVASGGPGATTLSISPNDGNSSCDNTAHTCKSSGAGVYTVTDTVTGAGSWHNDTASVTLTVNPPGFSTAVLADNPVRYYRFETGQTTVDSAPGASDVATLTGLSGGTGLTGNGADVVFPGSGSVTVSASGLQTTGARTVEMWVQTSYTGGRDLFFFGDGGGSSTFAMFINECAGCLSFYTPNSGIQSYSANIDDNNWHLVDVSYDGSNLVRIYKDGALIGIATVGALNTNTSGTVNIGGSHYRGAWVGGIDEVAYYNVALTDSQVGAHFAASNLITNSSASAGAYYTAVHANTPVIYYRFGESGYTFKNYGSSDVLATSVKDASALGATGVDSAGGTPVGITLGNSDWVDFSATPLTPSTGARTVEMWIKTNDTGSRDLFFEGNGGNNTTFALITNDSSQGDLRFYSAGGGDHTWVANLNNNQWHLIDIIYNGSSTISFYEDGVLIGTTPESGLNTSLTGGPVKVGSGNYRSPFVGSLDEFAMYSSALSQSQIANHYLASSYGALALAPANAAQLADTNETYTVTGRNASGASMGAVAPSNLTISPTSGGATTAAPFGCNVSAQTCEAHDLGVYTVTATYGSLSATTTLTIALTASIPGLTASMFTGCWTCTGNVVSTYIQNGAGEPNYHDGGPYPPGYVQHDNWGIVWTANFIAPVTGTYTFTTCSDDGSQVLIDGNVVLNNNWGGGQGNTCRSATIALTASTTHTILVQWGQGGGGWDISAYWTAPGGSQAFLTDTSGGNSLGLNTTP